MVPQPCAEVETTTFTHCRPSTCQTCAFISMRLINVETLELCSFHLPPPRYACLSHRWTALETTYDNFIKPETRSGPGFEKIKSLCEFLRDPQLYLDLGLAPVQWCWVDTACIDKRSSSELSEAINSMAKWYQDCEFCIAHLGDVPPLSDVGKSVEVYIRRSEWFTRAWSKCNNSIEVYLSTAISSTYLYTALQELLFPSCVIFVTQDWERIPAFDTRSEAANDIMSEITTIPKWCLANTEMMLRSTVGAKMRWAANRRSTRLEDQAYSLLGIFQINMPLLYGEGEQAFVRLQEQIIASYDDETIFAWFEPTCLPSTIMPILAPSPSFFRNVRMLIPVSLESRRPYRITNRGLEFESRAVKVYMLGAELRIIQLNCCQTRGKDNRVWLIALQKATELSNDLVPRWHRIYANFEADDLWEYLLSDGAKVEQMLPTEIYHIAISDKCIACMVPVVLHKANRLKLVTLDDLRESQDCGLKVEGVNGPSSNAMTALVKVEGRYLPELNRVEESDPFPQWPGSLLSFQPSASSGRFLAAPNCAPLTINHNSTRSPYSTNQSGNYSAEDDMSIRYDKHPTLAPISRYWTTPQELPVSMVSDLDFGYDNVGKITEYPDFTVAPDRDEVMLDVYEQSGSGRYLPTANASVLPQTSDSSTFTESGRFWSTRNCALP